jgi:hypothetical protein
MASTIGDAYLLKRVDFLTEDLKETGEHLRDTDRKISFLVQLYAGSFGLITALVGLIVVLIDKGVIKIDPSNPDSWKINEFTVPLLFLTTIYLALTHWLLVYTLKGRETKQTYINRMNFLRREIHYNLQTSHSDLPGFWTGASNIKWKIGLDELYPQALSVMILLCFGLFIFFWQINKENNWYIIALFVLNGILCIYSAYMWIKSGAAIKQLVGNYKRSTRHP